MNPRVCLPVLTIGNVIGCLKSVPSSILCFGRTKETGSIKITVSQNSYIRVCLLFPSQKWLIPLQLLEYLWREGRID